MSSTMSSRSTTLTWWQTASDRRAREKETSVIARTRPYTPLLHTTRQIRTSSHQLHRHRIGIPSRRREVMRILLPARRMAREWTSSDHLAYTHNQQQASHQALHGGLHLQRPRIYSPTRVVPDSAPMDLAIPTPCIRRVPSQDHQA